MSERNKRSVDAERINKAISDLEKTVLIAPSGEHYNALGILYGLTGNSDRADYSFRKAIEYSPEIPHYWYDYGVELIEQKRYKEALENFNKAIELQPAYTDAIKKRDYLLENFPV